MRRASWLGVLLSSSGLTACGVVATPAPGDRAELLGSGELEIHQINVGWGSSVLLVGPDGSTILLEAGNTGKGTGAVVPYLESIGLTPALGLDYTIAGHQHCDHIGGMDEVVQAGYDVRVQNYYNGSAYASSCVDEWNAASATTTAGPLVVPTPGDQIALGNGALLTFVAVNGQIIGGGSVAVSDENDRSIAALVQYGGFDYLWASDLGGGSSDGACTGRSTTQVDVESSVIEAISPGGAVPLIPAGGIDVLHVNHHGSESSTNAIWMNGAAPAVALIGTGAGQSSGWDFPRIDVVDHVLLAEATGCVTAAPALVLQTEEGAPAGSLTSYSGYCVGDIEVTTDGVSGFTVSADGQVTEGPNEVASAGLPRTFALDSAAPPPDTEAPTTALTAPAPGAMLAGTVTVDADANDNVGVTRVELWIDGALVASDPAAPYSFAWDTTTVGDGDHVLQSVAYDAAGNSGSSADVAVTVANADTTAPTAPTNLGATVAKRKVMLGWAAATDNVGVTGYQVWRAAGGAYSLVATVTGTSYTDTGLASGTSYAYYVEAQDAAGNVSAPSNVVMVKAR